MAMLHYVFFFGQTSQSGVVASHKEVKRLREDNRQMEKSVQQQRDDLDAVHKQLQAEKTARHHLTQQVIANRTRVFALLCLFFIIF